MLKRTLLIGTLALSACGTSGPRTFHVDVGCGEMTRLAPGASRSMAITSDRREERLNLLHPGWTRTAVVPVLNTSTRVVSGSDVVEVQGRNIVARKAGVAVIEVTGEVDGQRSTVQEVVLVEPVTPWLQVMASGPLLVAGARHEAMWEARGPSGQPVCAPASAFSPELRSTAHLTSRGPLALEEGARIRGVDVDGAERVFEGVVPDEARLIVVGEDQVQAALLHEGQPVASPARVRATVRTPAVCSLSRDAGPVDADPPVVVEPDGLFLRPREGVSEGRCVVALQPDPDARGEDALELEAAVDVAKLVSGAGDVAR